MLAERMSGDKKNSHKMQTIRTAAQIAKRRKAALFCSSKPICSRLPFLSLIATAMFHPSIPNINRTGMERKLSTPKRIVIKRRPFPPSSMIKEAMQKLSRNPRIARRTGMPSLPKGKKLSTIINSGQRRTDHEEDHIVGFGIVPS